MRLLLTSTTKSDTPHLVKSKLLILGIRILNTRFDKGADPKVLWKGLCGRGCEHGRGLGCWNQFNRRPYQPLKGWVTAPTDMHSQDANETDWPACRFELDQT
jgi:hypothetical protein